MGYSSRQNTKSSNVFSEGLGGGSERNRGNFLPSVQFYRQTPNFENVNV